jgi:hypothetical protein
MATNDQVRSNGAAINAVRKVIKITEEEAVDVVETLRPHIERPFQEALEKVIKGEKSNTVIKGNREMAIVSAQALLGIPFELAASITDEVMPHLEKPYIFALKDLG